MLYTAVALLGLVAGANALTIGTSGMRHTPSLKMQLERLPGEGDPFADGIRKPVDGPRPDEGIQRWHSDSGYIENDDEPWHSTCRPRTATITKGTLESTFEAALPFVAPEEGLMEALRQADSIDAIEKAIAACLAAGGRKGCPAIVAAEKSIKLAQKEGKVKKAPPAKVSAQGKGFDDMSRAVAKTHDNSV